MTTRVVFALAIVCGMASASAAQEAPPTLPQHGPALFSEPGFMTSAVDWAARFSGDDDTQTNKEGFSPRVGGMTTGAGWLSVGPGYRLQVFDGHAVVDASARVSWRGYKDATASLEFPRLAGGRLSFGSEAVWQDLTQVTYFGLGRESTAELRSHYRLQALTATGFARYRPLRWLAVGGRIGWLDGVSIDSATGPFKRDDLDARTTFAADPGMIDPDNPDFVYADASITADRRDYPGHPSSGGLYRASAAVFLDRGAEAYSFRRYEAEALQLLPLFRRAWVLAFHGWTSISNTSAGHAVPFYLTPSLGGSNTLRGFPNYRFHDRHLLLGTIESRWPLFQHVDAAVFVDSGTVAARVRDLGFDTTTYGAGVRVHAHSSTTARIDVARGGEGWQVLFRLNDPFRLSRLNRRTAAVPFVP